VQGDKFHSFTGVSFGGIPCAQYYADFVLWEALLNDNSGLEAIVELGTFQGGFSRYLNAQAVVREMSFVTFDVIEPSSPPPFFVKLDIYRYPEQVNDYLRRPVALFCDGGNKPRELKTFPPMCGEGSIFVVHDWGTETLATDVPDFLKEVYGDFCDEHGSASRVFRMKGEA
jgi:hypothetical protein